MVWRHDGGQSNDQSGGTGNSLTNGGRGDGSDKPDDDGLGRGRQFEMLQLCQREG